MKTAILVVDMQKDFFASERLRAREASLISNINTLTRLGRERRVPVIWVRQETKEDMSDASLGDKKEGRRIVITGTEGSKLVNGLQVKSADREVIKTRYSPFFKTGLDALLAELGVGRLIIAGINTHACVRMAAIDAYQRDMEVIVATDGVDSWDEAHHAVTLRYLSPKLATLMTNAEVEAALTSGALA